MKPTLFSHLLLASLVSSLAGCAVLPEADEDGAQDIEDAQIPIAAPSGQPWFKRVGDSTKNGLAFATNVVTDAAGSVIVTGIFNGTLDLGTGLLTSTGKKDSYVAKFSASGRPLWSKQFISSGDGYSISTAGGLAVDRKGDVYITGAFGGKVDFGGGLLESSWAASHFAVKLAADGKHVWSKNFADNTYGTPGAVVAVDASGDLLLSGSFRSTINFSSAAGVLVSGGGADVYVAKLTSDGTHVWSKRFGGPLDDQGYAVAADPSGALLLTGTVNGPVSFGGAPLATGPFVTKLAADGAHLWSKRFGDATSDIAYSLATSPSGDVVLGGEMTGSLDFGGGPLAPTGKNDLFLAKLSADGTQQWARHFGSDLRFDDNGGVRVAVSSSGEVLMGGAYATNIDLGGGTAAPDGIGGFLARYRADGSYVTERRFRGAGGTSSMSETSGVAIDSSGSVVAVGYCQGAVDFGSGVTSSKGFIDSFILKLTL
ncbi:MAG: SBBP repeat-containing protein [Polyangia bacterium]